MVKEVLNDETREVLSNPFDNIQKTKKAVAGLLETLDGFWDVVKANRIHASNPFANVTPGYVQNFAKRITNLSQMFEKEAGQWEKGKILKECFQMLKEAECMNKYTTIGDASEILKYINEYDNKERSKVQFIADFIMNKYSKEDKENE